MRAAASPRDRLAPSPPAACRGCCKAWVGAAGPEHQEGWGQRGAGNPWVDGAFSAGTVTQPSLSKDSSSTDAGDEGGRHDSVCDI